MGLGDQLILTFKNAQGTESGLWDRESRAPTTGDELMTRFLALEITFEAQQAGILAVLKRIGEIIEETK